MALKDKVYLPGLCATTEDLALAIQTIVEEEPVEVPIDELPCAVVGKVYAQTVGEGIGLVYVTETDPAACVSIPIGAPVASTLVVGVTQSSVAPGGIVDVDVAGDIVSFTNRTGRSLLGGSTVVADDGVEWIVTAGTPVLLEAESGANAPTSRTDMSGWNALTHIDGEVSDAAVNASGSTVVDTYSILPSVSAGNMVAFSMVYTGLGNPVLVPLTASLNARNLEKKTWLCGLPEAGEGETPELFLGKNSETCEPEWYEYTPGSGPGPDPDPPPPPDPGDEDWYIYITNIINNYYEEYPPECPCDDTESYPQWFLEWLVQFMERFTARTVVYDITSADLEILADLLQVTVYFETGTALLLDATDGGADAAVGTKVPVIDCPPPP